MTRTFIATALAGAALFASAPAFAAEDGKWEVKVLATGVLPDGKLDVDPVAAGLPAGTNTKANDNWVPTLAIEYYATPNVSIETICCFTQHHVTGTGALAGADIAQHLLILPATLTLKYHLGEGAIRPYVGAGPALFFYFGEKPGADAQALGLTSLKMDNKVGAALQAGIDVAVNDKGMGVTLDAKRYFMKATTHFYANGVEALSTDHKLDPWVVSAGAYFRF